MIRTVVGIAAVSLASLGLAACGERSQQLDHAEKKPDAQPWAVSDGAVPAFRAPGWKEGDKTSWEEQIRKRNNAQNDYVR